MKDSKLYFAIAGLVFSMAMLLNSCKEVGPFLPWGNDGVFTSTTWIESTPQQAQTKNALIEEITGVSCSNCPNAHVVLDNLISSTDNRVIGVSYHIGGKEWPQDELPPGTSQNMTSVDAQTIVNSFGFPGMGPIGAVDRILQGSSIWDSYLNWGGDVSPEIAEKPPVNIYLSGIYNTTATTKQVNITVSLHYTAAQTDTDKLSIFLTEDSIVTAQQMPVVGTYGSADDTFYVHNHIMRAAVSNPLGNILSIPDFKAGRVDSLAFTYTLTPADSLWNPAHMNVVAFVHKYQNGRSDILQSQIIRVAP